MPQPGCTDGGPLEQGGRHFTNPWAIQLGRERWGLGHIRSTEMESSCSENRLRKETTVQPCPPLKAEKTLAFTHKNMSVETINLSSNSPSHSRISWISILQTLERNHALKNKKKNCIYFSFSSWGGAFFVLLLSYFLFVLFCFYLILFF